MTLSRPAALDALEATAREAAFAESGFRENYAREIARLETARSRAYRRYNFLSALISADAAAPDREASRAAQRAAAADELGWDEIDDRRAEILAGLDPLSDAVHDERLAPGEAAAPAEDAQLVLASTSAGPDRSSVLLAALAAFEARFEESRGTPFAELFDRHRPETPLVDF